MKHRVIPLLAFGATLAGCGDAATAARTPNDDTVNLRGAASMGALLAVEDAASRVAPALGDRAVGVALASSLDELAASMRRGDAAAALPASRLARRTLDAYAERAALDDASDRDVIAMALDGADRLLVPAASQQ